MKTMVKAALVLAVVVALGGLAFAGGEKEVTVSGDISCAKCTLKKADAKECQDVLVAKGANAGEYYLVKNEALEKFGHSCQGAKNATVTGTVKEKEGKMWLTAKKIEAAKQG